MPDLPAVSTSLKRLRYAPEGRRSTYPERCPGLYADAPSCLERLLLATLFMPARSDAALGERASSPLYNIWRARGPPSQWLRLSGQRVKRCDKVAQRLQLVLRHNYRLDSLAVEHQHAVDQIHRSDIADVDDIAAAHAEKRRRLVGRSITRSDGFIENGQGGEIRTHLAITYAGRKEISSNLGSLSEDGVKLLLSDKNRDLINSVV